LLTHVLRYSFLAAKMRRRNKDENFALLKKLSIFQHSKKDRATSKNEKEDYFDDSSFTETSSDIIITSGITFPISAIIHAFFYVLSYNKLKAGFSYVRLFVNEP